MVAYKRKLAVKNNPRKRRAVKARIPRAVRPYYPIFKCQRTSYIGNWQPTTNVVDGFWRRYTWSLAQVNNSAEFLALFDQYRICAVRWTFRPRFDNYAGNDTTDTTLPSITNQTGCKLHIVNDPWSTVAPSGLYGAGTLNTFLEQGKVKSYEGIRPVSVYFKPVVGFTVNGTSSALRRAPWMNVTDNNSTHAGFHVFAQDPGLTGTFGQSWDMFVTTYMMFKNLR